MIALVVNPWAGRGRARARAAEVERALHALGEVRRFETTAAGDERRCARDACAAGAQVVAVVGGDGSVHHAARGLLEEVPDESHTHVPLAIFAAGTGNDYVKTLGTPSHDVAAMVACVARANTRLVDVGFIDGVPFLNAAGLGFDVDVLERLLQVRWLSGTSAYVVTALRALLGYGGYRASIEGAGPPHDGQHLLTVFANGRTFGGAFQIAPHAQLNDGMLAFVNIGALAPWARPAVFVRATRGTHLTHAAVRHAVGSSFSIASPAPLRFEADGELYHARQAPLVVTVRPRALSVIAP
ncbi:diacylglycerol/lipid kinase family protein [Gemmatimonas sp.]